MASHTDHGGHSILKTDRRVSEGTNLLYLLDDPFSAFPIVSVASSLAELVGKSEVERASRSMWGQLPPNWYAVQDEHDIDVESHLLGAAFVLAQSVITEAVSIMVRLANLDPEANWLPSKKAEILLFEAAANPVTGVSAVTAIDAVANYVKHRHEWPSHWQGASSQQRATITTLLKIGLSPGGHAPNLHRALVALGARSDQLLPLVDLVITWRQRIAERVRREWSLPSPHD